MKLYHALAFLSLLILPFSARAQSPQLRARQNAKEAAALTEKGFLDRALPLLREAVQLDSANREIAGELGYLYYRLEQYDSALVYYRSRASRPEADEASFETLGSIYTHLNRPDEALAVYQEGMARFAGSGRLTEAMGNYYYKKEAFDSALHWYEQGIAAAPAYSGNYYRASQLFLDSDEKVWGLIYGELFINLEPNTARTRVISRRLYDTYRSQIRRKGDSVVGVDFSREDQVTVKGGKPVMPFGTFIFTPLLRKSASGAGGLDLEGLCRMRAAFLDTYFKGMHKEHPNVLFDYGQEVTRAGHGDAYHHFILLSGDKAAAASWQQTHEKAWADFVQWYAAHPLKLDAARKFVRS